MLKMYFEIENTPEYIRKARRQESKREVFVREEIPRLVIAPFKKPPQVIFENVVIGTSCERNLEVFNPFKQVQQISLSRSLPPGLVIDLPGEWLVLEPETCYCLTMVWTPLQPTSLRETIRFTNDSRGRYDVIIVLKSSVNIKGKPQPKGFKTSPGKIKKKTSKRSPVAIYKKKAEIIYNTTHMKKSVKMIQTQHKLYSTANKENVSPMNDMSIDTRSEKCPFGSQNSIDFIFNTSEVFPHDRKTHTEDILQSTYDKYFMTSNLEPHVPQNELKPANEHNYNTTTDVFDNLAFTPLKGDPGKSEKLNKGPQIVLTPNSDSELDDSLDIKYGNKENGSNSIVCVSSQARNEWMNMAPFRAPQIPLAETPNVQNKKIPNTSSPKEMNSPNFSINTEFSRISDLSFLPQRSLTERKVNLKPGHETQDMLDDLKLSSDTYTKDSPNGNAYPSIDPRVNIPGFLDSRPQQYQQQNRICRQSLLKDFDQQKDACVKNYMKIPMYESDAWHNELRQDVRSPPGSLTPPLQSIPEESSQFSETQVLDRTDKQTETFLINRTFDKANERSSLSQSNKQNWSRKSVRTDPEKWKIPVTQPKKSLKPKIKKNYDSNQTKVNNTTFESNKTITQNICLNYIGNVYSQSLTVDPFLSSTYFYDEEAVDKFEVEFRRWLNYILTPPADLESNIEQKVDVGKAWLENRNKEVPVAPTKEQVCSNYHNSHRLDSLRKSARALLMSPEIAQVFVKLNMQIEKKLIAVRTDRNLHLDVGLQKMIMELLLSYNPLWLRIGLEAIYGLVIPLKSNSDIEGLTMFIIQRMFRNPFLRNKQSKSNAPNMLLPAYMEAIKKFTLKKFFMLVFFLDQAKQRKLISHDPCLFCRNAICKESREVIIRFTRELIAGIGDITKHLRPLGYVVSHKQSYLDEYKYAVHNIAIDIRDGVRLTKVMEIILIKNGLLNQLRTPAISRLQKIHNVQVALNALKEANFVIVGDINANDIADGHREKTLSLLWQLIHVFRAPLFDKAANVIQTWWKKKYQVIVAKRVEEEKIKKRLNDSAALIQCWWRRIQYNRLVEHQMKQVIISTVVIQKFCRMWLCKTRFTRMKKSVLIIEEWYRSVMKMREARQTLKVLREQWLLKREVSATLIQAHIKMWICKRRYVQLKTSTMKIQQWYRSLLKMREAQQTLCLLKEEWRIRRERAAIKIQTHVRRLICIKQYEILIKRKHFVENRSATIIQRAYRLKKQRDMIKLRNTSASKIQQWWHRVQCRRMVKEEIRQREEASVVLQKIYRMRLCRKRYTAVRTRVLQIQQWYRSLMVMREAQNELRILKEEWRVRRERAAVKIQTRVRRWICVTKYEILIKRQRFIEKHAAITLQRAYRLKRERDALKALQNESSLKIQRWWHRMQCRQLIKAQIKEREEAAVVLQKIYRMRLCRKKYTAVRTRVLQIQQWYRSVMVMREAQRTLCILKEEWRLKRESAAVIIQSYVRTWICVKQYEILIKRKNFTEKRAATVIQRAYRLKKERDFLKQLQYESSVKIQRWWHRVQCRRMVKEQIRQREEAAVVLQKIYRMRLCRKRYTAVRTRVLQIQQWYRSFMVMREAQKMLLVLREKRRLLEEGAAVVIQSYVRRWICIRHYKILVKRKQFIQNRAAVVIQRAYRLKMERDLIKKKNNDSAISIQRWWHRVQCRRMVKEQIRQREEAAVVLQKIYRMRLCRKRYTAIRTRVLQIQQWYRSVMVMREAQKTLCTLKEEWRLNRESAAITIQSYVRTWICVKEYKVLIKRKYFIENRAARTLQRAYRLKKCNEQKMKQQIDAAVCIQKHYRRYRVQLQNKILLEKVIFIQKLWKSKLVTRLVRCEYVQKRRFIIKLQSVVRGYLVRKQIQHTKERQQELEEEQRLNSAATIIQALFRGHLARRQCASDSRVSALRRRWREGALISTQDTLSDRNKEAMEVLNNICDIETVIKAFRSLELLTEVFPMMYKANASSVVRRVYIYMSVTNRSISSIEVLKLAAAMLVNLARHRYTGPAIYARDRMAPVLKLMWRFSNSETQLFCIFCTYLWLFAKYDNVREDLKEYLHIAENHKMLVAIQGNVDRMKRMAENSSRNRFSTTQQSNYMSHTLNQSMREARVLLPALEPDYGIKRADKPRYFEDASQAIHCLFQTYNL